MSALLDHARVPSMGNLAAISEASRQLAMGKSIYEVAQELELLVEDVIDLVDNYVMPGGRRSVQAQRAIDLARIELITKGIMPKCMAQDTDAIRAYVLLQKRKAAMLGLDAPTRQDSVVTIEVPWLKSSRFAYKQNAQLADDVGRGNVSDISPLIAVKRIAEEEIPE